MHHRILAAALALLALAGGLRAAPDVETRLARAGVPTGLRGQIMVSVARAGGWLASKMHEDGSFTQPGETTWFLGQHRAGVTPLCGLALEIAGERKAAERALLWISPDGEKVRDSVRGHAYAAALALRLLREHGESGKASPSLARTLASCQDEWTGRWAYRWTGNDDLGSIPGARTAAVPPVTDIDATRFAVEGLAAAEADGWRADRGTWSALVEGVLRLQGEDGALRFSAAFEEKPAGTAQGVECLALAAEAFRRRGPLPEGPARRLESARKSAAAALARELPDALRDRRRRGGGNGSDNVLLYNLASASAAAGVALPDGGDPWTAAAEMLLAEQRRDGSWSGGSPADDLVATAFAVLVLARSFDGFLPDAPPPAAAAPRAAEWPDEGAAAPRTTVPAEDAEDTLALLEARVADPGTAVPALVAALRLVGRCHGNLGPLPEAAALEWNRRAEAAFLRALGSGRPDPDTGRNVASEANRVAAALLGYCHARVLPALREVLEERVFPGDRGDTTPGVLRAAFAALERLKDPEAPAWFLETCLGTEISGPRSERALEALRAVPLFPDLPEEARRDAAARICAVYEGLERRAYYQSLPTSRKGEKAALEAWRVYRVPVLEALAALTRDPATGAPAMDKGGRLVESVLGYRQWLRLQARQGPPTRQER